MDFGFIVSAVFLLVALFLGFGLISSCFVVTRQKTVNVLETFGKYSGVRRPGLSVKWPSPIQVVVQTLDLKIQEIVEEVEVKTNDNAFLTIPVKVQIQIIPDKIKAAFYKLDNPEAQILSYIVNQVRSKASGMSMDEIFEKKSDFEDSVEKGLATVFENYGYKVVNLLVDDPQVSSDLRHAFERVIAAKRDKEAADKEKEAIRLRTVGMAEAEADSLKIKAEAYASQRNTMAEGNSTAIAKFCEGLDITHSEALKFFGDWDVRDAIRDAAAGAGNTVVIPASMSNELADLITKLQAAAPTADK